ncbi:Oplophorus-luciferin 2-monooxygenase non-catalytic subunit [Armadillidium nasatum]|uniref:Oplophorus-luciferin 2-monooxygenase non-catalytic subunit n=1 Tax=Armadillidium nasatum TaxID=96803 RepID=A0A5N5SKN3_9CRUS|nr:Oplophorus-luciferin 2-monooxygenase non-catalytic subunit [Armadillidium nasatum]
MSYPISKMRTSNWIQILAIFITLLLKIESTPIITYEEFYIFPRIYLKFSFESSSSSDDPKGLVIVHGYKSDSQSPLSVDSDVYNHIRKYEFHVTAANSTENEEQRVQEMNIIYEMCHVASQTNNGLASLFRCPDEAVIYPCTCTELEKFLNCSDVNSLTELKQLLNDASFPSTKFDKFSYYPASPSIEQRVLLDNTFGSLSFERMMFGDSGLVKVEANALSGSESTLLVLHFDNNNNLQDVPYQEILANFPQLTTLLTIKGSITEIPTLKSTSLTLLDLNTNLISVLQYDTFQNLPKLKTLDLAYNKIETIGPRGWLFSTNSYVYVDHNNLQSVSAFANYQPCIFDANHNQLTSFNQDVFEPILKQKYFVNVVSNEISCTDLNWVEDDPEYCPYVSSDCNQYCILL